MFGFFTIRKMFWLHSIYSVQICSYFVATNS